MSDDKNDPSAETPSASTSTITKKQWLIAASLVVTVLVIVYTILHASFCSSHGEKIRQLSKNEFVAVTSIVQSDSTICNRDKEVRVFKYLNRVMDLKDSSQLDTLIQEQGVDNVNYLATYPFRVNSYFWLTDYWVLIEVIFWSLFGLMANLMYSVTRSREEDVDGDGKLDKYEVFDPTRIPEHIGKFWYTPFTSVVIYLSLDALTSSGEIKETPEGAYVVVFAFILGFFTRRTIALLRKLKDIFFPSDDSSSPAPSEPQESEQETDPDNGNETVKFPAVKISGTVKSGEASPKAGFAAGTVIKLYAQSDPKTVIETVTVAKGAQGAFSFPKPVAIGEYEYSAEKTLKTKTYTGAGKVSVDGSKEEVSVEVLLK
ncbi:MAG: hypothetical protein Crog4KO_19710 [Crocinitomicaceae bacterium]